MKKLLILSGKGGTGKTTLAGALSGYPVPEDTRIAMWMPPTSIWFSPRIWSR